MNCLAMVLKEYQMTGYKCWMSAESVPSSVFVVSTQYHLIVLI